MIPAAIQALLPQHPGEENRIGHSGAQVVMYEDCVLKVQPDTGNAANEGIMLRFLKGRLPVPEVLAEAVQGGMRYLLMTRLRGRMLCDETFLDNQPLLARRMADAAEMLWRVDIAGCPCPCALDDVLRKAEADIAAGRVTIDTANQPDTYGAGGFASPEALLAWLKANRPPETLVLSHGASVYRTSSRTKRELSASLIWGRRAVPTDGATSTKDCGACGRIRPGFLAERRARSTETPSFPR